MLLYRTDAGPVVEHEGHWRLFEADWNELVNDDQLVATLASGIRSLTAVPGFAALAQRPQAPIGERQELWAAGVTYLRSRTARMEESETAGGGDFYDRVYQADARSCF